MRTTTIASALVLTAALAAPVWAQPATAPSTTAPGAMTAAPTGSPLSALRGSEIVGKAVYSSTGERIGEVEDVVINQSGKSPSVVLGVGGFLGIGERKVALPLDQIQPAPNDRLTVNLTKDTLKAMPPYDERAGGWTRWERDRRLGEGWAGTSTAATPTGPGSAETVGGITFPGPQGTAPGAPAADRPATSPGSMGMSPADRPASSGTVAVTPTPGTTVGTVTDWGENHPLYAMRGEQIVGRNLYGADGEKIGDIENLVVGPTTKTPAIVVGVGGFLGIGERHIAIPLDQVRVGPNSQLTTSLTRQRIEAMQPYDERAGGWRRLDPTRALRDWDRG